jgi:hypothetical protein
VYKAGHLYLSFKSFPASSGRGRTGPPVYVYRVFGNDFTGGGGVDEGFTEYLHCCEFQARISG